MYAGGLLSTAQSYPSLTSGGGNTAGTGAPGGPQCQALTMSLTSTSSDSEQVSLEVIIAFFFFVSPCFLNYQSNGGGFMKTKFLRRFKIQSI